ncbi:IS5 family transposase [Pelomonas aquatica]|uniref:IS5 family transposase n=1 Tax=Pelomonas aquatica TaxID=431058 RepID=A0ABU1ZBK4_9BURK|nr:IS5 family transposase [Pelomonas aquatica]
MLLREVQRKMTTLEQAVQDQLKPWLERAERIRSQRPHDKNKLYALHAPEVECISKGKARRPYEFGVKVSLAVAHKSGLIVGARSFPNNPFDGHTLSAQLEQTSTLLQDIGVKPKVAVVDLGYRGADADIAPVELIHRGKYKSLNALQRRWRKRRQAIEPTIGHTKHDHRMDKCWLKGSEGDAPARGAVRGRLQYPLVVAGAGAPTPGQRPEARLLGLDRRLGGLAGSGHGGVQQRPRRPCCSIAPVAAAPVMTANCSPERSINELRAEMDFAGLTT